MNSAEARCERCATTQPSKTGISSSSSKGCAASDQRPSPDYAPAGEKDENKAGKLAEAGGKTIINTIIPFRGLVREITGAAAARRRLNDAVDAGLARRGFLRGVQMAKGCRKGPAVPGGAS